MVRGSRSLEAERRPLPVSTSQRILIVEGSRFFSNQVRRAVEAATGTQTIVAQTLAAAQKAIAAERARGGFALALFDIILPDATENEVVDLCREKGLPSVVFTGFYSDELRERLTSSRTVIDYIVKDTPASLAMLRQTVTRIWRNRVTKALAVDDSATARRYLVDLLQLYQFQTLEAANGKQALEILHQHPDIRLVVTDYRMPVMDGIDMIKQMRASHPKDRLAVIGIATGGGSSLSAQFIKSGANDFITKPFLREEFFCRINQNMEILDLFESIRDSANRDYLTGIYNRRYLFEVGTKLLAAQRRKQIAVAAAMFDVDFFKKINDTYGHEAGDAVLKALAALLRERVRDTDIVARFGGEEFCLLAVNLDPKKAKEFFEGLRQGISEMRVRAKGQQLSITASIGVCLEELTNLDDLLSKADAMLYRAKEKGRNRVEIAK
ncbi:MAG: diguanylate cyclase [Rhodospirillales bacterium]|nr:diguanylate cyclase [Rhodospirillales bacterium]